VRCISLLLDLIGPVSLRSLFLLLQRFLVRALTSKGEFTMEPQEAAKKALVELYGAVPFLVLTFLLVIYLFR